jgi:hypothetical protein
VQLRANAFTDWILLRTAESAAALRFPPTRSGIARLLL